MAKKAGLGKLAILFSGLGYGVGFLIGTIFASLALNNFLSRRLEVIIDSQQPLLRLVLAIVFILFVLFVSGGISGFIGAYVLTRFTGLKIKSIKKKNFVAFGTAHTIVIIPLLFATSIIAFYSDGTDLKISEFLKLFGVYGAIYGTVSGLILAITMRGSRLRVWFASFFAFTLGGIGFGLVVWLFQSLLDGSIVNKLAVWTGFLVAGTIAGSILSYTFLTLKRKLPKNASKIDKKYLPRKLKVAVGVILLILVSLATLNFVRKVVVHDANLSQVIYPKAQSVVFEGSDENFDLAKYKCDARGLNSISKEVYNIINSPKYNPNRQMIPFCNNKYERLFFAPNPSEKYSNETKTPNGAYDLVSDMTLNANHEVLFATMMWDENTTKFNPGVFYAKAINDLYHKVKENPENYPDGMSVKILTGHMPIMAAFELGDQSWHVLQDLRTAGLAEMENQEIGWKIEVADYKGIWPHSHSKFIVVDGRSVMAAGFNYSYLHFPQNHYSGLGNDKVDLGIQVTGPVAQIAVSTFDDLWEGSSQKVCSNLYPKIDSLWGFYCNKVEAQVNHPEKSLVYFVPDNETSNAFSLYRSEKHSLGDDVIVAAISNAKERIDILEVNFSLEMVCDLAIVYRGVCTYENNSLPYMQAIMHAVETNNVPVRIIVEESNMNGLENKVSINAFFDELKKKDLEEYVEIKYHYGNMHTKAFNVDDKFLVVGSQNFHYSAWGEGGGLTEYSIGTDSKNAINDFNKLFEYEWERGEEVVRN